MTQEQFKEIVRINDRINELKKTIEVLNSYDNCRLSFVYDIKVGNGTPHPHIVHEHYLWSIKSTLNKYSNVIIQELNDELEALNRKVEDL